MMMIFDGIDYFIWRYDDDNTHNSGMSVVKTRLDLSGDTTMPIQTP